MAKKAGTAIALYFIAVAIIIGIATNEPSARAPTTDDLSIITPSSTQQETSPLTLVPTPEDEIPQEPVFTEARVTRIIDGDTIEVSVNGEIQTIRYIGIDTPEYNEAWGSEATEVNRRLVEHKLVTLKKDVSETDKYGRLLRYVYVESMSKDDVLNKWGMSLDDVRATVYLFSLIDQGKPLFINSILVALGYAEAYAYPPDLTYANYFSQLQETAELRGYGIWEQEADSDVLMYVGSINSNIYHYPSCIWAKKIKPENQIWFSSAEDAQAHGYRPCKVCEPPPASSSDYDPWEELAAIERFKNLF